MAIICAIIITATKIGGCPNMSNNKLCLFSNTYTIPKSTLPYTKLDTKQKTNWKASWIWNSRDSSKKMYGYVSERKLKFQKCLKN